MTREEALAIMWAAHVHPYEGAGKEFMYAELTEPVKMHEWSGKHPVEKNTVVRTVPAGTKVIVTVYSRLGDVGVRARNLDRVGHGYDARVDPEKLTNWRRAESFFDADAR